MAIPARLVFYIKEIGHEYTFYKMPCAITNDTCLDHILNWDLTVSSVTSFIAFLGVYGVVVGFDRSRSFASIGNVEPTFFRLGLREYLGGHYIRQNK